MNLHYAMLETICLMPIVAMLSRVLFNSVGYPKFPTDCCTSTLTCFIILIRVGSGFISFYIL